MLKWSLEADESMDPMDLALQACIQATRNGMRVEVRYLHFNVVARPNNCPVALAKNLRDAMGVKRSLFGHPDPELVLITTEKTV